MEQEAPIEYIKKYYETRLLRRLSFPEARVFYENQLKNVVGSRVLNLGCGPQFYDDLRHFGNLPIDYYGLDINSQNIQFLMNATHSELEKGRVLAQNHSIKSELVNGDILDAGVNFNNIDCAVSVGFLGVFNEKLFKQAIQHVKDWLVPSGRLVNLSWCNNFQENTLYRDRLKYRFNYPDNPEHNDIIQWTTDCGLTLKYEALYDVPDKKKYGWGNISSSVYQVTK